MGKLKTIREIAREYYVRYAFMGNDRAFAERHFEEGAAYMQVELTSWHDPKEKLPNDGQEVLCVTNRRYNTFSVLKHDNHGWWQYVPFYGGGWLGYDGDVLGWREIHENTKVSNESK